MQLYKQVTAWAYITSARNPAPMFLNIKFKGEKVRIMQVIIVLQMYLTHTFSEKSDATYSLPVTLIKRIRKNIYKENTMCCVS